MTETAPLRAPQYKFEGAAAAAAAEGDAPLPAPTASAVPKKRQKKTLDAAMQQRIAEALTDNNKSLAIPPAIVTASIDAAMTYTRSHALAVRDKQWAPSRKLPMLTFEEPPAEGEPDVNKFMAAGAQLLIADWREFGCDAFVCKCGADMVVMGHEKDVDGVKRDKLSCSTSGKLGLTPTPSPPPPPGPNQLGYADLMGGDRRARARVSIGAAAPVPAPPASGLLTWWQPLRRGSSVACRPFATRPQALLATMPFPC